MASILVIDDDPEVRLLIQKRFRAAGHEVSTASGGAEGIEMARRLRPDLIITDMMMPEGDGLTLVSEVRKDQDLLRTPVIMLTARSEMEDVLQGLKHGADDYIGKPFHIQELLARADALLRMGELQGQALEAERLKALLELAGAAAHEINQPLTVIVGYADLMLRRSTAEDPSRPFLQAIVDNATQIAATLRKLQAIRRYESKTYLGDIKILDVERSIQDQRTE